MFEVDPFGPKAAIKPASLSGTGHISEPCPIVAWRDPRRQEAEELDRVSIVRRDRRERHLGWGHWWRRKVHGFVVVIGQLEGERGRRERREIDDRCFIAVVEEFAASAEVLGPGRVVRLDRKGGAKDGRHGYGQAVPLAIVWSVPPSREAAAARTAS